VKQNCVKNPRKILVENCEELGGELVENLVENWWRIGGE